MLEDADVSPLRLWRAFVPRWAYQPLSGDGAARFGGRWNAVGQPTIYAAIELSTAWAEYNQGFVQHPALVAQLELSNGHLADLTDHSELVRLDIQSDIHRCEWRDDLDRGRSPATHVLVPHLLDMGYDGIRYPSFMLAGGTCVALWRWNGAGAPSLVVIDPENRLPLTPASWLDV